MRLDPGAKVRHFITGRVGVLVVPDCPPVDPFCWVRFGGDDFTTGVDPAALRSADETRPWKGAA